MLPGFRIQAMEILVWNSWKSSRMVHGSDTCGWTRCCLLRRSRRRRANLLAGCDSHLPWFLKDRVSPEPPGPWIWHSRSWPSFVYLAPRPSPGLARNRRQEKLPHSYYRRMNPTSEGPEGNCPLLLLPQPLGGPPWKVDLPRESFGSCDPILSSTATVIALRNGESDA